jgi:hypothetical protein
MPTLQTMPQPMQLHRQNIHATKPPPATGDRAVMLLRQPISLYNMRSHSSSKLLKILQSARNGHKVMLVTAIPTDQVSRVDENSTYVELGTTFYPHADENQAPKVVKVLMPKTWAPQMYLSTLNKSIKRHLILSLESMSLQQGQTYTTINELQWLFSATEEATHSQLTCLASHVRVYGGVLKKV